MKKKKAESQVPVLVLERVLDISSAGKLAAILREHGSTTELLATYAPVPGAPAAVHYSPSQNHTEFVESTNFAIGVGDNTHYIACVEGLCVNDVLVYYSDALVETPDKKGDFLNEQQVADCVRLYASRPARAIMAEILRLLDSHRADALNDDLTLCVIKIAS